MNDEIDVPKATDATLFNKIFQKFNNQTEVFLLPTGDSSKNTFTIQPYIGSVQYKIDGFLIKNKYSMHDDITDLLDTDSTEFIRVELALQTTGSRRSKVTSLSRKFRLQLSALIDTLNESDPQFIRCIKPNEELCQGVFAGSTVLDQLRCAGIMEAIQMQRRGNNTSNLYQRHRLMAPNIVQGLCWSL